MKQKFKSLIREVDVRNKNGEITTLFGVSISKEFIKSVANIIGTDLSKYKVVRKNQFVCSLMQVSRDERIPIALWGKDESIIVSPAYKVFEVIDEEKVLPEYLALWYKRDEFDREASYYGVGGVRGSLEWEDFCEMEIPMLSLEEQKTTVASYHKIEERIKIKRQINDNLEAQMEALFDEHVVNAEAFDYNESLDENIDFINGLAMQNFRPKCNDDAIPVIKIRELTQGYCDNNSEYCSKSIDETHIIRNGDLVFSWSGSLQAAFWTSQTAGLNQHLFKVQSNKYPMWYVYRWVIHYLLSFKRIADNKGTTFGHIKREDLHAAKIKSLNNEKLDILNRVFTPLLKAIVRNATELHSLMELQSVLLAQLSR